MSKSYNTTTYCCLREVAEKYHADLGGRELVAGGLRLAGREPPGPGPLFTSFHDREIEFLLLPGALLDHGLWYRCRAIPDRAFEVKPGHRLLSLGVIEVTPSDAVKQGIFRQRLAIDPPPIGGRIRRVARGTRRLPPSSLTG